MKQTPYEFCVEVNNEAIKAYEGLSAAKSFVPVEGFFDAKRYIDGMEDYEKGRTDCLAYIIDTAAPEYRNIYDFVASAINPEDLKPVLSPAEFKNIKQFVRKMRTLSNRVQRFEAAL